MNMLLDFALDYLGFALMVSGFILGARTLTSIVMDLKTAVQSWRDIDLEDWVDLGVCAAFLLVGRLMTLY